MKFKKRVCPECLRDYKHSRSGRQERKVGGAWGSGKWPGWVYTLGTARRCDRHLAEGAARGAMRRVRIREASFDCVDPDAIKAIYLECARITNETGIPHQVDHIVPLKGKIVSGLHVPWNLQIIPARENRKKSNNFQIETVVF